MYNMCTQTTLQLVDFTVGNAENAETVERETLDTRWAAPPWWAKMNDEHSCMNLVTLVLQNETYPPRAARSRCCAFQVVRNEQ